ncbi:bZIP transcription factor [Aspergillus alliaceus]|uniref:bZIP transcription factor n=1 Tax=Petromyces alliaceus TaxID=209559 RepID=UPI0012A5A64E|nr:uncharacterized protein BDW43DRAFT_312077 [Aspergillus alliaceus]KAB8232394.1 hypothetical protein BDW43DRAFT_312077 [Aspergillus alliaceus]
MTSTINIDPLLEEASRSINLNHVTHGGAFTSTPYQDFRRNGTDGIRRTAHTGSSLLLSGTQHCSDMKGIFTEIPNDSFPPYPMQPSLGTCMSPLDIFDDMPSARPGSTTRSDRHPPTITDAGRWTSVSTNLQNLSQGAEVHNEPEMFQATKTLSGPSAPQRAEPKHQNSKRKDSPAVDTPQEGRRESRFAKYRERNREAARRSREKQRELAESLESKAASLEYKRDALLEEVEDLKCNVQELSQGVMALHSLARSPRTSLQQPPTSTSVCVYCGGLCAPYGC